MRYRGIPDLTVRDGIFYFRKRVPTALQVRVGRSEIKWSLGTRDPLRARESCRRLSSYYEGVMETVAKNPTLTKKDIDQLVRRHFEGMVETANDMRSMARAMVPGFDIDTEVSGALERVDEARRELATGASDYTRDRARHLWDEKRFGPVQPGSDAFTQLCDGLLRAEREGSRILAALLEGRLEDVEVQDKLFDGVDLTRLPPIPGEEDEAGADAEPRTLAALADRYCDHKKKAGEWGISAEQENRRVLDWFIREHGGETPPAEIIQTHVRDFRNLLMRLPPNFTKNSRFDGLSLSQIADRAEGVTLSPKSRFKYFVAIKAFFGWAASEGYIPANPVGGITMSSKGTAKSTRRKFTDDELTRLFRSPLYTGCKGPKRRTQPGDNVIRDGLFWLPLVGLFTGMRLAEIIQLPVANVREAEGVSYLDMTGLKLKTETSERHVPVHPELIRLGFLGYVREQGKIGPEARVFEGFKIGTDKDPGGPAGKRVNRYLREAVSDDRNLVFHSFRHTFNAALDRAGLQDSRRRKLMGHAGEGTTDTDYGSLLEGVYLADDMEKVIYPGLDLSHLYEKD